MPVKPIVLVGKRFHTIKVLLISQEQSRTHQIWMMSTEGSGQRESVQHSAVQVFSLTHQSSSGTQLALCLMTPVPAHSELLLDFAQRCLRCQCWTIHSSERKKKEQLTMTVSSLILRLIHAPRNFLVTSKYKAGLKGVLLHLTHVHQGLGWPWQTAY